MKRKQKVIKKNKKKVKIKTENLYSEKDKFYVLSITSFIFNLKENDFFWTIMKEKQN